MQCPSCGAQVSEIAATCAVCGEVLDRSALAIESAGVGRSGRLVAVPSLNRTPEPGPARCKTCGSGLDRGASFCSECGGAVHTGEYASPPLPDELGVAPLEDDVALEEEVALQDVVVVPAAFAPEPTPMPPLEPPTGEYEVDLTGPIPVVREPAPAEALSSWVPAAAAAFAVFALLVAMLVHVFGPSSLPDYSPAELSLKIQMRAIEWLLAGTLIALVGLLAKR